MLFRSGGYLRTGRGPAPVTERDPISGSVPPCRIGTARSYGGGSVRRAQIIRFWASLCAPGICWRAGRERSFVPEAGCPGGRHTDALPRGDLCLFGSAAHSPSIHHPARRRWLPSLGQAGRGARVPTTLCDSLLPNSCASEFRAVSARAARRHQRAVLRRHSAVRDWAPFEHLGLL